MEVRSSEGLGRTFHLPDALSRLGLPIADLDLANCSRVAQEDLDCIFVVFRKILQVKKLEATNDRFKRFRKMPNLLSVAPDVLKRRLFDRGV